MTNYRLPAGIISEAKDHMNMLGDFIGWMDSQGDPLYEAIRVVDGMHNWTSEDYYVSCDAPSSNDSEFAIAIFDAMSDLTRFLPKDHMFGFSEGKMGIFHCPITIIVEPEPEEGHASIETLQSIAQLIEGLHATAKRLHEEAGAEICRLGLKISEADKYFLQAACELSNVATKNGSGADFVLRRLMGDINYQINVRNRKG